MVGFLSEEIDKQERLSDADKFSQFWLLVPEYWVATFYQQSASLKSHPALQTCGSVITLITIHNTCQRVGIIIHRNYLLKNHLSHGEMGAAIKAVLQEPAFSKWHSHVWLVCCMSCPYYALSGIDHVVTLSENPNSGLPARLEENPSDPPTVSAHKPIKPLAASIPFFLANWGALATEHNGALQKTTSTMTR